MRELRVPKLNNNDDAYLLVQWCVGEGEPLDPGGAVATVETSKAIQDLVSAEGGFLHQLVREKTECAVGALIGYLFDSEQARLAFVAASAQPSAEAHHEPVITAPAQALMRELGLGRDDLSHLPYKVIKRADVERLAGAAGADGRTFQLSRTQQAVAAVVTRSHSSIPAAFVAVDLFDDTAREARRAHGADTGVIPLLLKVIGAVRATHPLFFGTYRDANKVVVADGAHVAFAFDVGHGLYLPVVRDVQHRGVAEIAEQLDRFRTQAREGAFTEADLSGANIGLSPHTYHGVVAAQPLISPGQSVMLSPCATRTEPAVGRDGQIVSRSVFQLGMAYDHRVINGRDAVVFLRAIKSQFERADRVQRLLRD